METVESVDVGSAGGASGKADADRVRPRYWGPVLVALGGLVGGIGFDFCFEPAGWVYWVGFVGAVSAWIVGRVAARRIGEGLAGLALAIAVGVAAFSTGGVRHAASFRWVGANHIVRFTRSEPVAARVRGVVVSEVRISQRPTHVFAKWLPFAPRSSFFLDVSGMELASGWSVATGRVRVSVKERFEAVRVGDRVEVYGRLSRLMGTSNPGEFDWGLYQRRNGVRAGLSVDHGQGIRVLDREEADLWNRGRTWFRRRVTGLLLEDLDETSESSGLLRTMVLGQRHAVDRTLNDAFVRTGAAHFLAVSGLHVGMIAGFVLLAGRVFDLSRRGTAMLSACVIGAYVLAADPRAPVLRAGVMGGFLLLSILSDRPTRASLWLPSAAVLLLLIRPTWLFSVSFQMSFVVVSAVTYLTPALARSVDAARRRLRGQVPADDDLVRPIQLRRLRFPEGTTLRRGATRWFGWYVAVCVAAWLAGAPLAAYHFGQVSLLGWAGSLVLCGFVFVVLLCACVKVGLSLVVPTAGMWFSPVLVCATDLLTGVVRWMEGIGGMSVSLSRPPVALVLGVYALLAGWAWDWRLFGRRLWRVGLGVVLVVGTVWWLWPIENPPGRLTVTCLAVGNGSAILIELPEGGYLAYDAGTLSSYDVGGNVVVPAARAMGIRRVSDVIVSHPNLDHFNAVPALGESLGLKRVWVSEHFASLAGERGASRFFLDYVDGLGLRREVLGGSTVRDWGGAEVEVLWPPAEPTFELTANESSLVIRLRYAGRSILLCGDIEQRAQATLLAGGDLRADVLVLPHHGAFVANTQAFVEAVGAKVLIRSTGVRDAHSNAKLMELVRKYDYYSTAEVGAVTAEFSKAGLAVRSFVDGKRGRS